MRILAEETLLSVIDVQERLTPHIADYQRVVARIERLINGAKALDVPVVVSEQYKKGLGDTVAELQSVIANAPRFEKVTFSVCDDAPTLTHFQSLNCRNVILCGIETHVCVMQTALDLLANDFQPIVVADAVGSRFDSDHDTALRRLANAGVIVTTSESLLFELCRSSKSPAFKAISGLVK